MRSAWQLPGCLLRGRPSYSTDFAHLLLRARQPPGALIQRRPVSFTQSAHYTLCRISARINHHADVSNAPSPCTRRTSLLRPNTSNYGETVHTKASKLRHVTPSLGREPTSDEVKIPTDLEALINLMGYNPLEETGTRKDSPEEPSFNLRYSSDDILSGSQLSKRLFGAVPDPNGEHSHPANKRTRDVLVGFRYRDLPEYATSEDRWRLGLTVYKLAKPMFGATDRQCREGYSERIESMAKQTEGDKNTVELFSANLPEGARVLFYESVMNQYPELEPWCQLYYNRLRSRRIRDKEGIWKRAVIIKVRRNDEELHNAVQAAIPGPSDSEENTPVRHYTVSYKGDSSESEDVEAPDLLASKGAPVMVEETHRFSPLAEQEPLEQDFYVQSDDSAEPDSHSDQEMNTFTGHGENDGPTELETRSDQAKHTPIAPSQNKDLAESDTPARHATDIFVVQGQNANSVGRESSEQDDYVLKDDPTESSTDFDQAKYTFMVQGQSKNRQNLCKTDKFSASVLARARSFFSAHEPFVLWAGDEWQQQAQSHLQDGTSDSLPEVAFLGRSNVGKSSLLNVVLNKNQIFAKDGRVPGVTKTMHAYGLSRARYKINRIKEKGTHRAIANERKGQPSHESAKPIFLGAGPSNDNAIKLAIVDSPGYGFGSRPIQGEKMLAYLQSRKQLKMVFLLIHATAGFKARDRQLIEILTKSGVPWQIVITQADLLLTRRKKKKGKKKEEIEEEKEKPQLDKLLANVTSSTVVDGTISNVPITAVGHADWKTYAHSQDKSFGIDAVRAEILAVTGAVDPGKGDDYDSVAIRKYEPASRHEDTNTSPATGVVDPEEVDDDDGVEIRKYKSASPYVEPITKPAPRVNMSQRERMKVAAEEEKQKKREALLHERPKGMGMKKWRKKKTQIRLELQRQSHMAWFGPQMTEKGSEKPKAKEMKKAPKREVAPDEEELELGTEKLPWQVNAELRKQSFRNNRLEKAATRDPDTTDQTPWKPHRKPSIREKKQQISAELEEKTGLASWQIKLINRETEKKRREQRSSMARRDSNIWRPRR